MLYERINLCTRKKERSISEDELKGEKKKCSQQKQYKFRQFRKFLCTFATQVELFAMTNFSAKRTNRTKKYVCKSWKKQKREREAKIYVLIIK